tara:strand:+ start:1427 stop:1630 length:204 start_codon:yes stop_codon:yes gene_type:complete
MKELKAYTSIGSYPLLYLTNANQVLCSCCATDEEEEVTAHINYEVTDLYCDECSTRIESAYGEEEEE